MTECGGCLGLGAHRFECPQRPGYRFAHVLARRAEDLGDTIGANNPGAANACYLAASLLRKHERREV